MRDGVSRVHLPTKATLPPPRRRPSAPTLFSRLLRGRFSSGGAAVAERVQTVATGAWCSLRWVKAMFTGCGVAVVVWLTLVVTEPPQIDNRILQMPSEPSPSDLNIFFVEASCWEKPVSKDVKGEGLLLTRRDACHIEAAASLHRDRRVYVLHTCPVNQSALQDDSRVRAQMAALGMHNVKLWVASALDFFPDSPLERWLKDDTLNQKKSARLVLPMLLLWRYGGVYVGRDVMLIRGLKHRNFAVANEDLVSDSVLGASSDALGHQFVDVFLNEVRAQAFISPPSWQYEATQEITRVLKLFCHTIWVKLMNAVQCGGFDVLQKEQFFPSWWLDWRRLFVLKPSAGSLDEIHTRSFAIHTWNKLSARRNVSLTSLQLYAVLARTFCPKVVAAAGEYL